MQRATDVVAALALLCIGLSGTANADEAQQWRAIAPADPLTDVGIEFDSQFAPGVRVEIGEADESGNRTLNVSGCGANNTRSSTTTLSERGKLVIAYELSDTVQEASSCAVDLLLRFSCDAPGAPEVRSWGVSIILLGGRFAVGSDYRGQCD